MARIVLVHDDPDFSDHARTALRAAGHEVAAYSGSMEALHALRQEEDVHLLVTRVRFPEGTPHHLIALARMAQSRRPGLEIIFTARPDMEEFTKGLGELIPHPVRIPDLVDAVNRLVDAGEPSFCHARERQKIGIEA
jgi:DNA-binding NtrC family response regulator